MDSNVNPVIAAIVIALVLISAGIWMWGTGAAGELSGPADIEVAPNAHLYVQVQNQLLEHDADGRFVRQHDLSSLGVDRLIGGIAFFPDGDLLVRVGPDSRGLLDKLRAFARMTNEHPVTSQSRQTGLRKCGLQDLRCTPFGPEPIDFKATFGVFVDPSNEDVYISDTSRHVVRKYSANGIQTAGPAAGFRFPNHLTVADDRLLVADTNHHSIRIVEPGTARFGELIESIPVTPPEAIAAGHRWPSHFTRVADSWWVNLMTTSMDNGGIYIFDEDWQFMQRAQLPAGADPIAMVLFAGEVLVTDWNNFRIHRFTSSGQALHDFSSAGLAQVFEASRTERLRIMLITWSTIAILLVIATILVVKGTSPATPGRGESSDGDDCAIRKAF